MTRLTHVMPTIRLSRERGRTTLVQLARPENREILHRTVQALAQDNDVTYMEALSELGALMAAAREIEEQKGRADVMPGRLALHLEALKLADAEGIDYVEAASRIKRGEE